MRVDRRGFFRIAGTALGLAWAGPPPARAGMSALEIHRATRNTLLGALKEQLPDLSGELPPFKSYPDAEPVALPEPETEPARPLTEALRAYAPAPGFEPEPVSLEQVSRLLHSANGVTGSHRFDSTSTRLRAAPSAGALYAGEVYLVAQRVKGLPPGVYYYSVLQHRLLRLRAGSFEQELGRAVERPGAIEGAAAAVLLTNVFRRYTQRYGHRGYRYTLVDSGHIGENLRLSAVSAGLGEAGWLRFHDGRLDALLGIDGRSEAVCALHALGRPRGDAGEARQVRRLVEKQRAGAGVPDALDSAPARYHGATKLVAAGPAPDAATPPDTSSERRPTDTNPERSRRAGSAARTVSALASADPASPESVTALPLADPLPDTAVEAAIRERRSALWFEPQAIALQQLALVAEAAAGHPALRRTPGVDLYFAAHHVAGLARGLYRFDPEGRRAGLLREADLREELTEACLRQEKVGVAAVAFFMIAHLEEAADRAGARSYRDLLLEAGGIGQRIYLAAEAAGLAARNLAAFLDDGLNALLGLDGRTRAVVHLTVLGHGGVERDREPDEA